MRGLIERVRRRLGDRMFRVMARDTARVQLKTCEISYGMRSPENLDIRLGLTGTQDKSGVLIIDTRETTGVIETVDGIGWKPQRNVAGKVASEVGVVAFEASTKGPFEQTEIEFGLRIPQSWNVEVLPIPPCVPRLVSRDDPLHSYRWSGPPMSVTSSQGVSSGGVRLGSALLTGWLLSDRAETVVDSDPFIFHSSQKWLEELTPFERHNLSLFLVKTSSALQSLHPIPDRIEMLVASPRPRSTWPNPTLPLPILAVPEDVVHSSGSVAVETPRALWQMSQAIWGGACRISGEFGGAVEGAFAALLVGETLVALGATKDAENFTLRLLHHARGRKRRDRRLANHLAIEMLQNRPSVLRR